MLSKRINGVRLEALRNNLTSFEKLPQESQDLMVGYLTFDDLCTHLGEEDRFDKFLKRRIRNRFNLFIKGVGKGNELLILNYMYKHIQTDFLKLLDKQTLIYLLTKSRVPESSFGVLDFEDIIGKLNIMSICNLMTGHKNLEVEIKNINSRRVGMDEQDYDEWD